MPNDAIRCHTIMNEYGIPDKITYMVRNTYSRSKASVRVGAEVTDWFAVEMGVRQGWVWSSLLFGLLIDWVWPWLAFKDKSAHTERN